MNSLGTSTSIYANSVSLPGSAEKDAAGSAASSLDNIEAGNRVFSPVDEPENTLSLASRDQKSANGREASSSVEEKGLELQQQNDRRVIEQLASRDREVRAHEQAHAAVGGQYAGAPSYSFQRGPDGVNYAVGGEVPISLSFGGGDPRAALAAADQVRRAALAPANPSAQDRRVAATATVAATQARIELAALAVEESQPEANTLAGQNDERSADKLNTSTLENPLSDNQPRTDQQLTDSRSAALRRAQLSEQLITSDYLRRDPGVGRVLDQLA